jgi:murein DD-endopeptidase MepM/ murein hydrolase activator NlpD
MGSSVLPLARVSLILLSVSGTLPSGSDLSPRTVALAPPGSGFPLARPPAPADTSDSCALAAGSTRLRPGGVAVLLLSCDETGATASISIAGVPLAVFPFPEGTSSSTSNSTFAALAGIDVSASPGVRKVAWRVKRAHGGSESGTLALVVEPLDFPTQRITVSRRFEELDAKTLARTAEEQRRLLEVLGRRSPDRLWRGEFVAPVPGEGSGFGSRRVVNGHASSPHSGLDLGATVGTPIQAANGGVVVLADTLFFAGGTVVLDHGLGLFTVYSHLSRISVSPGQRVERGEPIALSGATGRVTGPHLHWAVKLAGARVDPRSLVDAIAAVASKAAPPPRDTTLSRD